MFKDQEQYFQLRHLLSDIICLAVVYVVLMPFSVSLLDFETSGGVFGNGLNYFGSLYFIVAPFFILSPLLIWKIITKRLKGRYPTQKGKILLILIVPVLCWGGILFDLQISLIKGLISVGLLLVILGGILILNRLYLAHSLASSHTSRFLIKNILITGTGPVAQKFFEYVQSHPQTGLRIAGFLTINDKNTDSNILGSKILGKIDDIADVIADHYVDCVVNPGEVQNAKDYGSIYMACATRGVDFITSRVLSEGVFYNVMQVSKETLGSIEFTIFKYVYRDPVQVFIKRIFDFSLSFVLIICSLPLWAAIAVSIKMTSRGPVFFRQMRVGRYGKPFMLYKFRSMVDGAEKMQKDLAKYNEMDGPAFKIKHDPRQTITGKFLRRTSLDELPQLLNVFKGDISLVGPRPAIPSEVEMYRPWERKRLSVCQGITCVWQVSGRNTIKFDEWMKLDLMYMENWSLVSDFQILLRTIPAVLLKKGAY